MPTHRRSRRAGTTVSPVISGMVLIFLIAASAVIYALSTQNRQDVALEKKIENLNAQIAQQQIAASHEKPGNTLLYFEETTSNDNVENSHPIVTIYKKSGGAAPDLLATLTTYPSEIKLSPDNQSLLVSSEGKLSLLNIASKKTVALPYVPRYGVESSAFSQDGKHLLILDEKAIDQSGAYALVDFNLATGTSAILTEGSDQRPLTVERWRTDDTAILSEPLGEAVRLATFNFKTKQIVITYDVNVGMLSKSGKLMTHAVNFVPNACDFFGGSAQSVTSVIDPYTQKQISTFGTKGKTVNAIAFSPDETEIVYTEREPITSEVDCAKVPAPTYYVSKIGGTPRQIQDPVALFAEWKAPFPATEAVGDNGTGFRIMEGATQVVPSTPNQLRIIGQY